MEKFQPIKEVNPSKRQEADNASPSVSKISIYQKDCVGISFGSMIKCLGWAIMVFMDAINNKSSLASITIVHAKKIKSETLSE